MGWRDLLSRDDETIVAPWTGSKSLRVGPRTWLIERFPPEHGWATFAVRGQRASYQAPAEPQALALRCRGYLAGNRLLADNAQLEQDPIALAMRAPVVHLLPEGLPRFSRVTAGCVAEGTPLVYLTTEWPLGPESAVQAAFEERCDLTGIKEVTPALAQAFQLEVWQRADIERRRAAAEARRRQQETARALEEQRAQLQLAVGTSAGRRALAKIDFEAAARAALAISGAELLDHRGAGRPGEHVVRFRFLTRRFECIVDANLQVVDAGVCLTAHDDDEDFAGGTKGDTWFTLESLPGVIREAHAAGKLVVFRHV